MYTIGMLVVTKALSLLSSDRATVLPAQVRPASGWWSINKTLYNYVVFEKPLPGA
jgi:hypothetical protein